MIKIALKNFHNAVIVNGKRTPIGSLMGALSNNSATDLGAAAIKGTLIVSKVNEEEVEECIMGNVVSAGLGQAPARQAAIKAGLKASTVCTTVNKVCSSGLKSISLAAQSIRLGDRQTVIAGGMESMSLVPHYTYMRKPLTYGNSNTFDGIISDGLFDSFNNLMMGNCAEKTVKDLNITRRECDEYCVTSYERARKAQADNILSKEIVPIELTTKKSKVSVEQDEEPANFRPDKIPTLRSVFEKEGAITAANASKLNDGGASVLVMNEELANKRNLAPIARIIAYDDAEIDSIDFSIAPSSAIRGVLEKSGLKIEQIDFFEINEAFSSVALANMKILGLPHERVNVHGGAVALGHPIGMSGTRLVLSLVNALQTHKGRYGIASICNGGGGASAILVENLKI